MGSNFKLYNGALLRLAAFLLAWCGAWAQTEMPVGVFRGTLTAWHGTPAGDLTIRDTQGADLLCHYDGHSFLQRDHFRVPAASIKTGEIVEILADNKPGSRACYARMIMVVNPDAERAADLAREKLMQSGDRPFFFTPKGDRTMAGMVVRVTSRLLMLRTRTGETTLVLRPDTRYIDEGMQAKPAELHVNTRVFVRAGRTIDGLVEAYQVMWGNILAVR